LQMLQSDSAIFKSNETPEDVVLLPIPQVHIPAIYPELRASANS
jgi:hypothetical protein